MSEKVKYIRCPRCELNYIKEEDGFCDVCKAEIAHEDEGTTEYEKEIILCPVCKMNYINSVESMCTQCKIEQKQKQKRSGGDEDSWKEFLDEDEDNNDEENEVVSLSEIVEEEDDEYREDVDQEELMDIYESINE